MVTRISRWFPALIIIAFLCAPRLTFAAEWANIGFPDKNVKTVFVDPKNNKHILLSLTTYVDGNYNRYSEDGGTTWTPVNMGGTMTQCNNFALNPKSTGEVWAGCATGLYRSVDGGKNFLVIPNFRTTASVSVNVSANGVIYMTSTGNNLQRSFDGIVWETLRPPGSSNIPIIFLNKHNPGEIYLSATGTGPNGLFKSTDNGSTWTLLNGAPPLTKGVNQLIFQSSGKMCASASTVGISCSTDGGFTWNPFASPNTSTPNEYQHSYQLVQNPDDEANLLVLASTWTGQDNKLYSYKEGVTLPEFLLLSQSFTEVTVSQGVVYGWGSVSGRSMGVWRNDGIAVVPEYLKKHPVIIVPGILGSWPVRGVWTIDPILNTYTDLIKAFENNGYAMGKDLFVLPYDWHRDNNYTATLLKIKIDEAKESSGANKVDIVAHSMGGLVTRSYLEGDSYSNDVNQVVFLGTPHMGSAKSYPTWEAGDVTFESGIVGGLLNYIFTEEAKNNGYLGEEGLFNYIHEKIATLEQLLPITNYLEKAGVRLVYPDGYPRNYYLEYLDNKKGLIKDRGIEVTNIVGLIPEKTVSRYAVQDVWMGSFWANGMPINYYTTGSGVYRDTGDNTVSLTSQLGLFGRTLTVPGVAHIDLPKKAIREVLSSIVASYSPIEAVTTVNKYLLFAAYSPVDFYIVAPDGKRIGYNSLGSSYSEIPGAFYTGNESETEFLVIPNPLPGEYKVVAVGTGEGSYEIKATYADDEGDKTMSSSYVGQATAGKVDNLTVELTPESDVITTTIDDKTAPATTFKIEGTKTGDYYNSEVTISLSASDIESGIAKTEYSLDGVLWQEYTQPLVLVDDGETNISYRSIDKADNIEAIINEIILIDKTPPVVDIQTRTRLTRWDKLNLVCKISDVYSGVSTAIVRLDGLEVICGQDIVLFDKTPGAHILDYIVMDKAGNVTVGSKNIEIQATIRSTVRDIWWLYTNKHFRNRGDAISIIAHIRYRQLFSYSHHNHRYNDHFDLIIRDLRQFNRKKRLSDFGYDMIMKDIKYILEEK